MEYKIKSLPNRTKLVESIAEARIAVRKYLECWEDLKQLSKQRPHIVHVDAMNAVDEAKRRYTVALESMEKQIVVAGSDYVILTKPILLFIQTGIIYANKPGDDDVHSTLLEFMTCLDESIRQAVDNIDRLNQRASHN